MASDNNSSGCLGVLLIVLVLLVWGINVSVHQIETDVHKIRQLLERENP
jgi:hypothetical protein